MPGELTVRSGRVKRARRLATKSFRTETSEFLAEGPQAVREALAEGQALEVFVSERVAERHEDLRFLDAEVEWNTVSDEVLDSIADSVTPQGIVARCALVQAELDAVVRPDASLVVVCVDIRDPGNAGSVVRAADAVGADGVVFAGESVDPWNPKAVRASVGSLFHLPLVVERDTAQVFTRLREAGLNVLVADAGGDSNLYQTELGVPTAWVFGNEAHGVSQETREAADRVVSIPIHGRAESLNLATAVAVCLYASARAQHTGD